ncbi:hypothetical protein B0H10DRAFT_2428488 [Mycena sp. CBHHK59/15]|nr:hypothetical protein B0H10DRAFT_2428488 [Mycena sp. CBHHK59/15]
MDAFATLEFPVSAASDASPLSQPIPAEAGDATPRDEERYGSGDATTYCTIAMPSSFSSLCKQTLDTPARLPIHVTPYPELFDFPLCSLFTFRLQLYLVLCCID